MGSNERRAREREEMRRRILEAARNLFAAEGFEAVTLRKVADCIEYCPATIYKYFADKNEMVRALVEDDVATIMASLRPGLAHPSPLERLRSFGRAYVELGLSRPNHYRMMFMSPLLPPDDPRLDVPRAPPEDDPQTVCLAVVRDCIAEGVFRPELTDPQVITQTLWAGLHGVVSLHIACGTKPGIDWRPVRERAHFMHELMLNGMLREPRWPLPAVSGEERPTVAAVPAEALEQTG